MSKEKVVISNMGKTPTINPVEKSTEGPRLAPIKGVTASRAVKPVDKFKKAVLGEDDSIRSHLWFDFLVPGTKNILWELVTNSLRMGLYDRHGRGGGPQTRPGGFAQPQYTNYSRSIHQGYPAPYTPPGRVAEVGFSTTDDVVFKTRAEVDVVLTTLYDITERYNRVTITDFYDLIGMTARSTDSRWGWDAEMISRANVMPIRGGFAIRLPEPRAL